MGKKARRQSVSDASSPKTTAGGKTSKSKRRSRKSEKREHQAQESQQVEEPNHNQYRRKSDATAVRLAVARAKAINVTRLTLRLWHKWVDQDRGTCLGRAHYKWTLRQRNARMTALVVTTHFINRGVTAAYGRPKLRESAFVAVDTYYSEMYEASIENSNERPTYSSL